jgi:hypothetical protein
MKTGMKKRVGLVPHMSLDKKPKRTLEPGGAEPKKDGSDEEEMEENGGFYEMLNHKGKEARKRKRDALAVRLRVRGHERVTKRIHGRTARGYPMSADSMGHKDDDEDCEGGNEESPDDTAEVEAHEAVIWLDEVEEEELVKKEKEEAERRAALV